MDINPISSNSAGYASYFQTSNDKAKTSPSGKNGTDTLSKRRPPVHVNGYTANGQATGIAPNNGDKAAVLNQQIRKEIWDQAYVLLQAYSEESNLGSNFEAGLSKIQMLSSDPQDPIGLHAYFQENPEDWQQVEMGLVPDYFNIENTGNRILDVWLGDSQGADASVEFLTSVKDLINQAYGEVTGMLGELPQLVQDTQSYIQEQLDALIATAETEPQVGTNMIDTMA